MPYKIDSMGKCNRFIQKFTDNGWRLWQTQYSIDCPEGFHAWFAKAGEQDIELVTYDSQIQKAIVKCTPSWG